MMTLVRPLLVVFALLTLITGLAYPLLVAGAGCVFFPNQVSGSLLMDNDKLKGSALLSQSFRDPKHFWGRLSATSPMPNNTLASSGSNFGPSNPALLEAAKARIAALRAADPDNSAAVPVDLVTASGSGLDPHISPAAALYQVKRVAAARHMDETALRQKILAAVEAPQWGIFGEPRINVLLLNRALDQGS